MTNDKTVTMSRELAERMLRNGLWPTEADELREVLAAPVVERQPEQQMASMPVERCYDVRVKMIIAFNESRKAGGDLDDGLDAAYKAALRYSPNPLLASPPAPVAVYAIPCRKYPAHSVENAPACRSDCPCAQPTPVRVEPPEGEVPPGTHHNNDGLDSYR